MSDYFTAYKKRLLRNQEELLGLVKDVVALDPTIEVYVHHEYPQRILSSITFFKDETINNIGFHEVPYRWSGCGYGEFNLSHYGGDNVSMPFIADDVLTTFKPVTKKLNIQPHGFFKSKEQYLKKYSYLKQLEL